MFLNIRYLTFVKLTCKDVNKIILLTNYNLKILNIDQNVYIYNIVLTLQKHMIYKLNLKNIN